MKIAVVTQGYQSAGGVQAVARWLVAGLEANGDSVTVLNVASGRSDANSRRLLSPKTWHAGPKVRKDEEPGVFQVGTLAAELEPLRYLPSRAFKRELARHESVIVVAGAPALARMVAGFSGPRVLQVATRAAWERASIHEASVLPRRIWSVMMTGIVSCMERHALRSATSILVENPEMLIEVRRLAPTSLSELAPPGIDCRHFENPEGWSADGPIVSVGRLGEPRKGWARMFRAYANLVSVMPSAPRLVIGGRGQLSVNDLSVLDEVSLGDRIEVHRDLAPAKLRGLLHSGSVFWQTSFEEGLGIAAIEAMAAGLPVIATRTAGTEMSVEDGVTGYLVEQDSQLPANFAFRTQLVLSDDGSMSQRAAYRAVAKFDSSVTLRAFIDATRR